LVGLGPPFGTTTLSPPASSTAADGSGAAAAAALLQPTSVLGSNGTLFTFNPAAASGLKAGLDSSAVGQPPSHHAFQFVEAGAAAHQHGLVPQQAFPHHQHHHLQQHALQQEQEQEQTHEMHHAQPLPQYPADQAAAPYFGLKASHMSGAGDMDAVTYGYLPRGHTMTTHPGHAHHGFPSSSGLTGPIAGISLAHGGGSFVGDQSPHITAGILSGTAGHPAFCTAPAGPHVAHGGAAAYEGATAGEPVVGAVDVGFGPRPVIRDAQAASIADVMRFAADAPPAGDHVAHQPHHPHH
jgi:hypothetical protein